MSLRMTYTLLTLAGTTSLALAVLVHGILPRALLALLAAYFLMAPALVLHSRFKYWLRQKRGLCICGRKLDGGGICPTCMTRLRSLTMQNKP